MSSTPTRNRLAATRSPYLLQHADNPVDWYPWGDDALRLAREQDKPILLSIGYSACHWCHVMAHESFEDPATAALMNRLFINIKVDREERPDLDRIYQLAHQMLTGRGGGWPLTMFLTPDQVPFFGGTYFPRTARHGLPAFTDLLDRVDAYYREHRPQIDQQNHQLLDALAQNQALGTAGGVDDTPLRRAIGELFVPDEAMVALFKETIEEHAIRELAVKQGMRTLQDQLAALVIEGTTSMEEAIRIGIKSR